jgi:hypothetical protein
MVCVRERGKRKKKRGEGGEEEREGRGGITITRRALAITRPIKKRAIIRPIKKRAIIQIPYLATVGGAIRHGAVSGRTNGVNRFEGRQRAPCFHPIVVRGG